MLKIQTLNPMTTQLFEYSTKTWFWEQSTHNQGRVYIYNDFIPASYSLNPSRCAAGRLIWPYKSSFRSKHLLHAWAQKPKNVSSGFLVFVTMPFVVD
jgi:hypothetical protein